MPRGRYELVVDPAFWEDLSHWIGTDRRKALRVLALVEATIREPFRGIGKPEPLRHELSGASSRRIDREHRLVYVVSEDRVHFLQARYHY